MKKYSIIFIFLWISMCSFAGNAHLFEVNEESLVNEFTELTQLETQLEKGEILTIETTNLKLKQQNSLNTLASQDFISDMDWESFAWGLCCCPVGCLIVVINQDKDETQKQSYWLGVLTNVLFVAGIVTTEIAVSAGSGGCVSY
jgi:hypothetical protein